MSPSRPVAPARDIGSPELAAALAAGHSIAVGRALQTGWVVVPVTRAAEHTRVVLDPAGPHPAAVDAGEVREILAAAPAAAPVPAGIRDDDRALDLELPLDDEWLRIDLTAVASERERQISAIVDRQLPGLTTGPILRTQLVQWLRRLARTAEGGGGRETAFLARRTEVAALALSVTRYWNRLGPPPTGGSHLDTLASRLAERGRDLVTAQLATGRLVRDVRAEEGDVRIGGEGLPVLAIDYWIEFPDRRGLCLVSFSAPQLDLGEAGSFRDALLALTDEIVVASTWVLATTDDEPEAAR